jgi:hypothetical protein
MCYDTQSDDEVHYDNLCVSLETSSYVPGTTSAQVPTEDYGDPVMTPEISEPVDRAPLNTEAPEPRPISTDPPATEGH